MKKRKILSLLLVAVIAAAMLQLGALPTFADTFFEDGDFRYAVTMGDTLLVAKYLGEDTDVALPASVNGRAVTGIRSGCFENSTVTSVTMPDTYTVIGAFAFSGCTALTAAPLPAALETVGIMAFYGCTALQNADFTATPQLQSIGFAAFSDCTSLETVALPASVTELGDNAFCNCTALSSLTLSENLGTIPEYAFYGCSSLTTLEIPAAVSAIGEGAFENSALTAVYVPDTVTQLGDNAFAPDNSILCFEESAAAAYCLACGSEQAVIMERRIGDANQDGKVQISDVTAIQRHLAEMYSLTAPQMVLADVNGDGMVTIDDATLIQRYLAEFDVVLGQPET